MGKQLQIGDRIPEFCYDTPYEPQKSFYKLLDQDRPVMMIFLRNFGHPLTRHYVMQYVETIQHLRSVRLVCVVQTLPQNISKSIPKGALPFEVICDAEGVLYDYFEIPQCASKMKSYSLEALKIIKQAQKEGYVPSKDEPHQLPLTLVVAREGQVQFAHYGRSVTDLPMNCEAMQKVAEQLQLHMPTQEQNDWLEKADAQNTEDAAETESTFVQEEETVSEAELLATLLGNQQQEAKEMVPEEQSGWTKAEESNVYAPPVQEKKVAAPMQTMTGKFIDDRERTPKKIDFAALGFGGEN